MLKMKNSLLIYVLIGTLLKESFSRTLHPNSNLRQAIKIKYEIQRFKQNLPKQLFTESDEFRCPTSSGVFPADDQCTGDYYLCVDGISYIQHCPGNFVFDDTKGQCVSPSESTCVPGSPVTTSSTRITSTTETITTTTATTTTPRVDNWTTTTSTSSTNIITTPAGGTFTCPSPNGNFPVPGTCGSNYYACIADFPYLTSCANGQIFDPNLNKCVPADEASCNPVFVCPIEDGFFPIPGVSCSGSYYVCMAGVPYLTNCPDGLIFDPVQIDCLPAEEASC